MLVKVTLYLPSKLLIRSLLVHAISFLIFLLFRRFISHDMSRMLSIILLSTQINNSTSSRRIFWLLNLMFPLRQLEGFLELALLLIYSAMLILFFLLSVFKHRERRNFILSSFVPVITSASNIFLNFMEVKMMRKLYHIVELLVTLLTSKSVTR